LQNNIIKIEHLGSQGFVSGESKRCTLDNGLTDSSKAGNLINQFKDHDSSHGGFVSEKWSNNLTSLYQRVLSALVVEEEFEEFEENNFGSDSLANRDDRFMVADRISCNGSAIHTGFSSGQIPMHEEIEEGNYSYMVPQTTSGTFQSDANGSLAIPKNAASDLTLECQYDQMCLDEKILLELQSIGLYPETVVRLFYGSNN